MSIKSKLVLSAIAATFAMGSAFAADAPAADASAPAKTVKKAPKKAVKKVPAKATTETTTPATK